MTRKNQPDFKQIGAILLVGMMAGAGARYVASRMRPTTAPSDTSGPAVQDQVSRLIDWEQARKVALRVAQWEQAPIADRARRREQYARLVARSQPLIANYLGVELAEPFTRVYIFDRREWLEANLLSFARLFKPIEELYHRTARSRPNSQAFSALNQKFLGAQVGFLLGFLARKVLGQYDLSLLSPEPTPGSLYFIEPNIARVQQGLGLHDEEFRLWITLHEMTHAYEFEAYGWVRDYFQSLLQQYFDEMGRQLEGLRNGFATFVMRILQSRGAKTHWIESMLTPRQREIFNKLQALMSIVEGYSNHIMNAIGRELLPTFDQIEARIHERQRNRSLIEQLFYRLTGMSLKMEQYQQGEAFVNAVVEARGPTFASLVWKGPENLPTMEEIRNPRKWIERMS
ncbi:MAG: hypothetical protein KatS3mg057_2852 [Herpetosiphonaceae bacterium]|nr:MAG: hypothetical protein KatS3mg057_2852 [Herpetosiphonaceae bacterium]